MEHVTPLGRGRFRRNGPAPEHGRLVVSAALVVAVVAADALVDGWIRSQVGAPVTVLGDVVRLRPSMNSGAAFGLLREAGLLVPVLSVVALALVVRLLADSSPRLVWLALALFLGGGVANLSERLLRLAVLDYVDLGIGDLRWPTFNIADVAISGAVVLLFVQAVRGTPGARAYGTSPPDGDTPASVGSDPPSQGSIDPPDRDRSRP